MKDNLIAKQKILVEEQNSSCKQQKIYMSPHLPHFPKIRVLDSRPKSTIIRINLHVAVMNRTGYQGFISVSVQKFWLCETCPKWEYLSKNVSWIDLSKIVNFQPFFNRVFWVLIWPDCGSFFFPDEGSNHGSGLPGLYYHKLIHVTRRILPQTHPHNSPTLKILTMAPVNRLTQTRLWSLHQLPDKTYKLSAHLDRDQVTE